ncbi:HAAS signaling domain-containing protein [Ruania albidiflava]|uniref:HAAS signaling domain-containing protein n=1 Tax=Ruania albidiflava TaxID=366586 RepID=UPI0023F1E882|nr:hypothetical protein [Ruania albidiflava]
MTEPIARTARYQDDLARLLAALEPVQRAEVLDGVREHIDAALAEVGHAPTDADVDRILGELGSPGMVAEAALAERPGVQVPEPNDRVGPAGGSWREQLMGRWVPPTAVIGLFLLGWWAFNPYTWIPLAVPVLLLVLSQLWTVPEKVFGALVPPVGLSVMTIGYRGGKRAKEHAHATT